MATKSSWWDKFLKIVIAVASAVLGAVGAGLLHLYLYGLAALVVAREAGVYRRAPAHGYSISSAAWNHTTVPITRTGPSSMPKIMSS